MTSPFERLREAMNQHATYAATDDEYAVSLVRPSDLSLALSVCEKARAFVGMEDPISNMILFAELEAALATLMKDSTDAL